MFLKGIQIHKEYDEDKDDILEIMKLNEELTYEKARIIHATNLRKTKDYKLNRESRSIIAFFQNELGKYENNQCDNICIDCSSTKETRIVSLDNIMGIIKYNFNYDKYLQLNKLEKKKTILKIIKDIFEIINKEYNWNLEQVYKALKSIEEKDYIYKGQFLKSKKNKSRKNTAKLVFEWDIDRIKMYLVITDKEENEIKCIKVIEDVADEFCFNKYLGNIKWISNEEVILIATDGKEYWRESIVS